MRVFDWVTLIFSIIAAGIAWIAGETVISFAYGNIFDEIVVGAYFAVCGFIIVFIMCFCVYKISKLKYEIPVNNIFLKSMITLVSLTVVISFVLGAGFEFLYSLGFKKNTATDNYIVTIDNSGSMANNDSNFERFNALDELFSSIKSNQKMGVYAFNDSNYNIIPLQNIDMSKISEYKKEIDYYKISNGGTNLMGSLRDIADYIDSSNIKGNSSVIVISDGECDIDDSVIDRFVKQGIPIHTIGVANGYKSLHNISEKTGGTYYDIKDVSNLKLTFETIYNLKNDNMLLERRAPKYSGNIGYAIMKVLFISILAIAIKIMELFILDIKDIRTSVAVECISLSILAGLILEFVMQNTDLNEYIVRFFMITLISIIFVFRLHKLQNTKLPKTIAGVDYELINNRLVGSSKGVSDRDERDNGRKSLK